MIRMLLTVAIFISIGLLTKPSAPPHINNQVATPKPPKVEEKKAEAPAKVTPQVIQDQTVTPIVTSSQPNCDAYDTLLARHFGDNIRIAKAVMQAESGCRSDAVGDGHITYVQNGVTYGMSCGLYQIRILPGRPSCEQLKNPGENIAYAGQLFAKSGWYPWSAYKNGAYLKHLK